MPRLWQKGLIAASSWAMRTARNGLTLPVPQSVIDRLSRRLADDSVYDLKIRPRPANRLELTGRRKVGVWLNFTAVFRLEPPGPEDPARSLVLVPEKIQPFPARAPMLGAMAAVNGIDRDGKRLRLNLDALMEAHEWGRRVPAAMRQRVRITGVEADESRIRVRLEFSRRARA